jgi:16S rRNA (cytosine967-C5)-methyltransferase
VATGARSAHRVSPARWCAYRVVRRVFEQGAYADRAFHAEAAGLESPRDRALAMNLAYGTIQRRRTLDHILARLSSRSADQLDPAILAALRLGLFQLALLDGIPDHAAVHESVELAKQEAHGGATLVNAVLRRAAREKLDLLSDLRDDTPQNAAVMHSVPGWIAEMWWRELGPEVARALLAHINQPAESAVRINTLKAQDLQLPVPHHAADELPEGRVLEAPFDVFGSEAFDRGLLMPQSRASMLVARSLAPQAGERVLDLCAAPGAKTTHLAALMANQGAVQAVEVHPGRAQALRETCVRMGATCVTVADRDGRLAPPETRGGYDRVLVDPPCSGLGTLQSRPDLRWQPGRADVQALATRQLQLLESGAAQLTRPGTLVYSVCTISRTESGEVINRFLSGHRDFHLESTRQLLPHADRTDGFFIARLTRG